MVIRRHHARMDYLTTTTTHHKSGENHMAHFRGTVWGNRSRGIGASRLGHSNLLTTANGWHGGVTVELSIRDGHDYATVTLTEGSGNGGTRVCLYNGPIDEATRARLAAQPRNNS